MGSGTLQSRIEYVDALRAFAMIAIVFLHAASPIEQNFLQHPICHWWIANSIYSCCRPAIALFLMLSGMLLLSPKKDESLLYFFKKRFIRIGIPFLVWGIIYFCWKTKMHGVDFTFVNAVKQFVVGPVYYHLWFIYTIAGIYLAVPIFRVYVKNAQKSNQLYLLVLWFIGTCLYPLIRQFADISVGIPLIVAGGFLGCFILGSFVRDIDIKRNKLWVVFVLLALFTSVTVFGTYGMTIHNNRIYDGTFADFLGPSVIGMALCIFFIFKHIPFYKLQKKMPLIYKCITVTSSTSFSVYLMHIMVMEILKSHIPWFTLEGATIHPLIGIPLTTIVSLTVCITLVVVLRKIPYVSYALP